MAGIIPEQAAAPPASAATPSGAAPAQGEDEAPNVTPQEQDQYDRVVAQAMQYIHGDGTDAIVERLKAGASDPPKAIGDVVAQLGQALSASAQEAGEQLDDAVMFHAAQEVVDDVAEVAVAAGVIPAIEDGLLEQALFHAMKGYGESVLKSGQQPDEDNQAMIAQLQQMGVGTEQGGAPAGQPGAPPTPGAMPAPAAPAGAPPASQPPPVA